MKNLLSVSIVLLATLIAGTAEVSKLSEGKYILVFYGGKLDVDPEVVTLTKSKRGDGLVMLRLLDVPTSSSVCIIPSGEYEGKDFTEVLISSVERVPTLRRQVNDKWKTVSYSMATLTLHGKINFQGAVRGAYVATEGRSPSPWVDQGQFVLKPLEAQQDGADQPATAPESKAEDKEKTKPESEVRPQ